MMTPTRTIWRPVRYFLLIACAGGILAVDDTWVNTLRLDFIDTSDWFPDPPGNETQAASAALPAEPAPAPIAQLSMGHLINGLFFSHPKGRWVLDSSENETRSLQLALLSNGDPTNQINSGDNFGSFGSQSLFASVAALSNPTNRSVAGPSVVTTASGTWAVDSSGTWSNAANWVANNIPDGAGATADFTQVDLTANRTVTLDVSRTVGSLTIGDTNGTHSYTLDASPNATLTFAQSDAGFTGILAQSSTSAGDTISAPIVIGNLNFLSIQNASTAPFTISGSISSAAGSKTVEFDSGHINVTGVISNGNAGNFVTVGVAGGSVVTLSGTNTYTGGTSLVGGTLFINGDNSGATGQILVANTGSLLGGIGTTGGSVNIGGGGTITGATDTTVGTFSIGSVTMQRNLTFNPGESSAKFLANLDGAFSDLLKISGTLSINGNTHLHFDGAADGMTTYTLATYTSETGSFIVDNLPAGYSLVYLPTELDLVPIAIPEPATWLGGALALGAVAFAKRRRCSRDR